MRVILAVTLTALLVAGCARSRRVQPPPQQIPDRSSPASTNLSVPVPKLDPKGRIASVNAQGRFVVITFPVGTMPALQQRLGLYRANAKVGEVKISGPQRDNNIVADIIAGECQIGDEVRPE